MMTRMLATATVFLASLGGCSASGMEAGRTGPREGPTVVEVTNQNWSAVNVYAVYSTLRIRMGTIGSYETERFRLPRGAISPTGEVRFLIDPIGSGRTFVTDRVQVMDGLGIEMTVQNHLPLTSLAVWELR